MAGYSPDALQSQLERIRQRRQMEAQNNPNSPIAARKDYRDSRSFRDFSPQELDTKLQETPLLEEMNNAVMGGDDEATATEIVKARNRYNLKQLERARRQMRQARRNRVQLQPLDLKSNQGHDHNRDPGVTPYTPSGPSNSKSSYYTQTPSWLNTNAGMTTFKVAGRSFTVNASVAGRFQGFLKELVGQGYKIYSHGSYANRNQANGSGRRSLHSYGLAIDLNPFGHGNSYNPGGRGKHYTNMPKNISALAAKYGLVWGGDWRTSKDYMHFSVPYQGLL